MRLGGMLNKNFQKFTTNRYVVNSPRFWRKEFHPYFKDLYAEEDFLEVLNAVNDGESFKLKTAAIEELASYMYKYFAAHRFAYIPAKNPQAVDLFIADLYFALKDGLPAVIYKNYPLVTDDFNVVNKRAQKDTKNTGALDSSTLNAKSGEINSTVEHTDMKDISTRQNSQVENDLDTTEQNTIQVTDVFLSPQDAGKAPINANVKNKGVEGIAFTAPTNAYTTNVNNINTGDSIKNNYSSTKGEQENTLNINQGDLSNIRNNDKSEMQMTKAERVTQEAGDLYENTLLYDKAQKLQQYFNLSDNALFTQILYRLEQWILRIDIATSETNYLECPIYK